MNDACAPTIAADIVAGLLREASVLLDPVARAVGAVAVGDLVAQHRARAGFRERRRHGRERAARSRSATRDGPRSWWFRRGARRRRRSKRSATRRRVRALGRAATRRAGGSRRTSSVARGGTACRARAPSTGDGARRRCRGSPGSPRQSIDLAAGGGRAVTDRDDPAAGDLHVGVREHDGRIERRDDRGAADRERHSTATSAPPAERPPFAGAPSPFAAVAASRRAAAAASLGTSAFAATESRIGQPRAPRALERVERAGDGGRRRDEADLADALRAVGALGLRAPRRSIGLDVGHRRRRDDPERLQRRRRAGPRPRRRSPR